MVEKNETPKTPEMPEMPEMTEEERDEFVVEQFEKMTADERYVTMARFDEVRGIDEKADVAWVEHQKATANAKRGETLPVYVEPTLPPASAEFNKIFPPQVIATVKARKASTGTGTKTPTEDNWLVLDGGKIAVHKWTAGTGKSKENVQRMLVSEKIPFTISTTGKPENAVEMTMAEAMEKISI